MAKKSIGELLNFGIIVVDKPTGPTSFSISDYVRRKLKLNKTSHFGTLDPLVTGVLPIALGRACRLTGTFLGHDKTYIGIMHTHKEQDMIALQEIINKNFTGTIVQLPPKKSRVRRQERERDVMQFKLLEQSDDKKDFLFIAEVQGGTYIRKLCSDLGDMIGGAHMAELRRVQAGVFVEKQAIRLYDFDKAVDEYEIKKNPEALIKMIIPAEDAIKQILPSFEIKESALFALRSGKPLFKRDLLKETIPIDEHFALFLREKFIGIYKRVKEDDIIARPEFVFN
jgi:H/ACA ribonucleoprotein complex subunit 4